VANDDDDGRAGCPPQPQGKNQKTQGRSRRQRRQPDRRQERPALKARMVLGHANMIAMNAATLPVPRVVILAAGFSTRLGAPKALARVRGVSLLRRTVALAARLVSSPIIVVVPRPTARYRIETRGFNVAFVANPGRADGLSSSVRRGIAHARRAPCVLLLPVDLAGLRSRDLARLILRWRAARRCVVARRIGQNGGTPLILPHWFYCAALEATGDIGLRDVVARLPERQRRLLDLPTAALDVDTPQDLHAARRLALRGPRTMPGLDG
jgi:molybdenum cofactor cytidylyltransferase